MKKLTMAVAVAVTAACVAEAGDLTAKIAEKHKVLKTTDWYGGRLTSFDFEGYEAWVVEPPTNVAVAAGNPWTWTMQWRDSFVKRTGVPRLLKAGYRHVTIDTFAENMNAKGLAVSKRFQDYLVGELGFAPKAKLIGMSWGGFFSVRYASTYPSAVEKIYLDAPLMNFQNFSHGVPASWKDLTPADGRWEASPEMPVNRFKPIAEAGIPILLLYGGQDATVVPADNCELFAPRFKEAGGSIKVVRRALFGHHPHGVELDDNIVVDFFEGK